MIVGPGKDAHMPTSTDTEIIFMVREDEVDGGYTASALGHGIHTQGDDMEDLRANICEAFDVFFDEDGPRPKIIRLYMVHQEVLAAP